MNSEDNWIFTLGIVVGASATILLLFAILTTTVDKSEVIKHNCGEYNSVTGHFQFIEKNIK